jgi:hypothetical protein
LKKAYQEQQEINEVLLCSIVTKKSPKDDNHEEEVSKRASKNSGAKIEKGDSLSEGTPSAEDKTIPDKKRKQTNHLEGEFKKIKPATFDGESRDRRRSRGMVVGHKKVLPNLQLFQQHECQNGHLQSEGEDQHLVEKPKIGQGPKGKTIGMVCL